MDRCLCSLARQVQATGGLGRIITAYRQVYFSSFSASHHLSQTPLCCSPDKIMKHLSQALSLEHQPTVPSHFFISRLISIWSTSYVWIKRATEVSVQLENPSRTVFHTAILDVFGGLEIRKKNIHKEMKLIYDTVGTNLTPAGNRSDKWITTLPEYPSQFTGSWIGKKNPSTPWTKRIPWNYMCHICNVFYTPRKASASKFRFAFDPGPCISLLWIPDKKSFLHCCLFPWRIKQLRMDLSTNHGNYRTQIQGGQKSFHQRTYLPQNRHEYSRPFCLTCTSSPSRIYSWIFRRK